MLLSAEGFLKLNDDVTNEILPIKWEENLLIRRQINGDTARLHFRLKPDTKKQLRINVFIEYCSAYLQNNRSTS